jgi:CDP-6-deoxy-D-xylo-4-hexulose-3-dehydrase
MGTQALLTGKWLTAGEYVVRFQNVFAKHFGVRYAHMVNSGSSANLVMLAAIKKHLLWKDGEEIIVSPVGFPTTIAPIVQNNLKPVFVDIEMSTLNFDLELVQDAITPRTKAILVSPVLGNPPHMDVLESLGVTLIGDNCDSLGSKWNGRYLTDFYSAWSTSFYPAHHITTGEGGMICSNDAEYMQIAKSMSWWGRACYCVGAANLLSCGTCGKRFSDWMGDGSTSDHKYIFDNIGYNLKPLDLQGAFGLAQMEKIEEIESKRRRNFKELSTIFDEMPNVRVAGRYLQADPCWFGVPLICDSAEIKNSLVSHLEKNLIQTRPYFAGNILKHPGYRHLGDYSTFPLANSVMEKVFFIGCPPFYTEGIIQYIEQTVKSWKL